MLNGRFIAFIDSDDIWEKNKLEKQINYMEKENIGFSFSGYARITEAEGKTTRIVEVPNKVDYNDLLRNTIILNSTVILDTEKVSKDLIHMPDMRTSEDVVMQLKILKSGIVAYGLNEQLIRYRIRKHSLSSNKFKNARNLWKIYRLNERLSFFKASKCVLGYAANALKKRIPFEMVKRVKEIFHFITFKEILDLIKYPFILLINLFVKKRIKAKKIWLVAENPYEACDNGYVFYKYLRENRKDINAFYVIKKKSKDFSKVEKLGNVIQPRSLKHWLYYLNAERIIVTQKYANPSPALFYLLHKKNIIKAPRVFLQHGVIKDDCPMFYYNGTMFRLFICGAKREYEYIKDHFGYPPQNVIYTGLARFDNLDTDSKTRNNFILIAPTWRKWIKRQKDFDKLMENYYGLLRNQELIKLIEENNIIIQLVMHKNMKKFKLHDDDLKSKNIIISHNKEINIQELINRADMLITDYSSIFMDIAYRKRPIIYYQFDKDKFRKNHLPEGYFSYEKDGFGEVVETTERLAKEIEQYIKNNFNIEEKYEKRMDEFFERKDKNNCKRILEEIEKI